MIAEAEAPSSLRTARWLSARSGRSGDGLTARRSPGYSSSTTLAMNLPTKWFTRAKGQIVLARLVDTSPNARDGGYVLGERASLIRDTQAPIEAVDGLADPQIEATINVIQNARRREEPEYWAAHALVLAKVASAGQPKAGGARSTLFLRPLLALGGELDAGTTPAIEATANLRAFGPAQDASRRRHGPRPARARRNVLPNRGRVPAVHSGGRRPAPPISVLNGPSDRTIMRAASEFHGLAWRTGHVVPFFRVRRPADRPSTVAIGSPAFWETGAVMLAMLSSPLDQHDFVGPFHSAGDAERRFRRLAAGRLWGPNCRPTPSASARTPTESGCGQLFLVAFYDTGKYSAVPGGKVEFIRDSRGAIQAVSGFSDPQIEATLKAIQELRKGQKPTYWASHAVVFAEVKSVTPQKAARDRATMVLWTKIDVRRNVRRGQDARGHRQWRP